MRWYPLEIFDRLELYMLECPEYRGDVFEKILVLMTYSPMFCLVFFFLTCFYVTRTVFHYLLWTGLSLNTLTVTLVGVFMPRGNLTPAACTQHNGKTVSEDAAIMAYILLFFFLFHLNHAYTGWIKTSALFVFFAISAIVHFFALLELQLYNMDEVGIGAVIGCIWATFVSIISITLVEPNMNSGTMANFMSLLRLKPGIYGVGKPPTHTYIPTRK